MLAWVWTIKYFRCYRYGKKFPVRTDNSVVTYLRNFAENNSRHLRWRPNLSELYFTVEHRAGFKIRPVDALSRHMGALIDEDIQDMNNVLREQAKDAFCVKQKPSYRTSSYPITFLHTPPRNKRSNKHRSPKERNFYDVLATTCQLEVITLNARKTKRCHETVSSLQTSAREYGNSATQAKFPDNTSIRK